MAERGWRPAGLADAFVAPETMVEPPLSVEWSLSIESYSHGGASVSGIARTMCTDVADKLLEFPESSLDSVILDFPDHNWRRRVLAELDAVSQGELLDPLGNYHQWIVADDESRETMVRELFGMIDGPLADWIEKRRSQTAFLDYYGHTENRAPGPTFRPTVVLSLMAGRVELARALVAGYQPSPYDDSTEQVAAFERELAERFPDYGPLQTA